MFSIERKIASWKFEKFFIKFCSNYSAEKSFSYFSSLYSFSTFFSSFSFLYYFAGFRKGVEGEECWVQGGWMPFFKNHYIISMKIYGVERSWASVEREKFNQTLCWCTSYCCSHHASSLSHISVNVFFFLFSRKVFCFESRERKL